MSCKKSAVVTVHIMFCKSYKKNYIRIDHTIPSVSNCWLFKTTHLHIQYERRAKVRPTTVPATTTVLQTVHRTSTFSGYVQFNQSNEDWKMAICPLMYSLLKPMYAINYKACFCMNAKPAEIHFNAMCETMHLLNLCLWLRWLRNTLTAYMGL